MRAGIKAGPSDRLLMQWQRKEARRQAASFVHVPMLPVEMLSGFCVTREHVGKLKRQQSNAPV